MMLPRGQVSGNRLTTVGVAALGIAAVLACKGESAERRGNKLPAAAPNVSATSKPRDTVGSYLHPLWTPADLEKVLREGGLMPTNAGEVKQPFLGPVGIRYRIGSSELQAYIYGDAVAVGRDTDNLDTILVAPPTMMVAWRVPPTLIVDNNLAIILLTRDDKLRERVRSLVKKSHPG